MKKHSTGYGMIRPSQRKKAETHIKEVKEELNKEYKISKKAVEELTFTVKKCEHTVRSCVDVHVNGPEKLVDRIISKGNRLFG